jgi:superfamily II DNA or RNA helicase
VPKVLVVDTKTTVDLRAVTQRFSGKLSQPLLINELSTNMERTELILRVLRKALREGRKVLVLSHRLAHLKEMKAEIERTTTFSAMLYIGATKQAERAKAKEFDVIFGQMDLVKEGLDIPELDTLFFATPTGSDVTVEQGTGRILRELEGKKQPIVVDFVDTPIGYCQGLFKKRKKTYQRLKYDMD